MNQFNEKFPGILAAYINDTCYTLDNSECNELSKFVEGLTSQLAAAQAEADKLRTENRSLRLYGEPMVREALAAAQAREARLRTALVEIDHGPVGYWTEGNNAEKVVRALMAIARADLAEKP